MAEESLTETWMCETPCIQIGGGGIAAMKVFGIESGPEGAVWYQADGFL